MWHHRSATLIAVAVVSLVGATACARQSVGSPRPEPAAVAMRPDTMTAAQRTGGMERGMMAMGQDSASMAQMAAIHELVMNHERIRQSVTNLPNGVRTVMESDDPRLAELIKQHVATMVERVNKGDDPGLPMESPAVHAIFRDKDKVRTSVETTTKGVVVVQTSPDSATVAALQQHASEMSDLAREGMAAMHAAMMKNGGMMHGDMMHNDKMHQEMMHSGMHGGMQMDTTTASHGGHAGHAMSNSDSAFGALQQRGMQAMGVDQYTSTHHFEELPDGGRIELQRDVDDPAGVAQIRQHLQEIARSFAAGDFSTPGFVHMQDVPGAKVMAAKRAKITYTYRELPRGGEVRIVTSDPEAVAAVHEFLTFQRRDHRAH